jgi:hypothetical protein
MYRREPPPLATWILEHLATGERDEALSGDLLEHHRAGRTDGWYWRQVLTACASSWSMSLAARGPVLLFALLWSALAPVWHAALDTIKYPLTFDLWSMGPLGWLLMLAGWIVVHAVFLWIGLFVYQFAHVLLKKPIWSRDIWRAFWLAAILLPPVTITVFIIGNLYQYSLPGLAHAKLASSSIRQIADLGILANLIRIPYFVALLCALWGAAPKSLREEQRMEADSLLEGVATSSGTMAVTTTLDRPTLQRFLTFMVGAGLVNALIAGVLLCRLPDFHSSGPGQLLTRALCYVGVGVLAGVFGICAYWQSPWSPFRDQSPIPFPLFALASASGWVWVPAMVLFYEALSAGTAFVAMIGAFFLATGLRRATYFVLTPVSSGSFFVVRGGGDLFEESLYRPPVDFSGYTIAVLLYMAGAALATRSIYIASTSLAMSAALFGWKKITPRSHSSEIRNQYRTASLRLALVLIPAVLVTAWALLTESALRARLAQNSAAPSVSSGPSSAAAKQPASKTRKIGYGGYESVILWPYPKKEDITAPVAIQGTLFGPGSHQPLILRFDGPYTYLQPPNKVPGPDAHKARGTPLDFNIKSNDFAPVVMEAHESLSQAIRVTRCSEIEVGIENMDNRPGAISLALLLTNRLSGKGETLYLGEQPLVSAQPGRFSIKTEPVFETLRFAVPANSKVRDFSQITMMVMPDVEHRYIAPKIAIQEISLFPR